MRLENKVILVTASTRGIGLACVKACAKEGAIVYMAARNLETAGKTAKELNAQGYHVKYVYMKHKNADKLLANLEQKQKKGEPITKTDLVPLILCPLMTGNSSQKDRINKAFYITHHAQHIKREDKDKIEAMLYAMADKFLDTADLEKLKEEIAMTRLGQMI